MDDVQYRWCVGAAGLVIVIGHCAFTLGRERHRDGVPVRRARGRARDDEAIDGDLTAVDPRLDARAGRRAHVGQVAAEDQIDAQPGIAAVGGQSTS